MLLYLVVTQLQCVGRPGNKDEPVGQGRNAELKSWLTARQRAACILTHPCPSLDASLPNGRTLRQSKDLIESPRLHSPRRVLRFSFAATPTRTAGAMMLGMCVLHLGATAVQVLSGSSSWIRFPSGSFKVAIRRSP